MAITGISALILVVRIITPIFFSQTSKTLWFYGCESSGTQITARASLFESAVNAQNHAPYDARMNHTTGNLPNVTLHRYPIKNRGKIWVNAHKLPSKLKSIDKNCLKQYAVN